MLTRLVPSVLLAMLALLLAGCGQRTPEMIAPEGDATSPQEQEGGTDGLAGNLTGMVDGVVTGAEATDGAQTRSAPPSPASVDSSGGAGGAPAAADGSGSPADGAAPADGPATSTTTAPIDSPLSSTPDAPAAATAETTAPTLPGVSGALPTVPVV